MLTTETNTKTNEEYSQYITFFRDYLLLNEKFNIATTMKNIHGLLTFIERIFSSPATAMTFAYFCVYGAATSWILQNELDMPEATTYRTLKRLRSMGILSPALNVRKVKESKGGPRPKIWALEDCDPASVATALQLHYKLLSPKFQIAEKVAQTILEDYILKRGLKEIPYKDIILHIKAMKTPFRVPDIAQLASTYIQERGIKVWR